MAMDQVILPAVTIQGNLWLSFKMVVIFCGHFMKEKLIQKNEAEHSRCVSRNLLTSKTEWLERQLIQARHSVPPVANHNPRVYQP